jgi:hypothetical protein
MSVKTVSPPITSTHFKLPPRNDGPLVQKLASLFESPHAINDIIINYPGQLPNFQLLQVKCLLAQAPDVLPPRFTIYDQYLSLVFLKFLVATLVGYARNLHLTMYDGELLIQ